VISDKVALNELDIVHRLTQNTRNTVMPDTEYFLKKSSLESAEQLQNLALYLATS